MKSVCAKHEQAFELECPYCEKKAEGPPAAPAAPPAAVLVCEVRPSCHNPATWRWTAVAGEALRLHGNAPRVICQHHQDGTDLGFFFGLGWQTERLP